MSHLPTPTPTSDEPDVPGPVVPNEKTIAFAVSVVKSKPPELSIEDYIKLLRQHIAPGRRENALSSVYSHLDRSAYWRSRAELVKVDLERAQDKAVDMRREIATLKRKLEERPPNPIKKRKRHDEDVVLVPRSPRKNKRATSPDRGMQLTVEHPTDAEFSQAGEFGAKATQRTTSSELAYHITRASSTIAQILQTEIRSIIAEQTKDNEQLKNALATTSRAITAVLAGYVRLTHVRDVSEGTAAQGRVIYAIVSMFRSLLCCFTLLSAGEIDKRPSTAHASSSEKPKGRSKARTIPLKDQKVKENPTMSLYTTFLGNLLDMLDPRVEANQALFEGFTYCILDQLGKSLYSVVFGHSRAPDLELELKLDDGVLHDGAASEASALQQEDEERKQTKLEAPYLLHLLNRIMIAAPAHFGNVHGVKNGKAKSNRAPAKNMLARSAKECLQRTLVHAIFGTENVNDDDPFKECLKMPTSVGGPLSMPKVKEADVLEYFKEEVWRCVGWDILAKEGDW
ncbi:uncharacterized protein SEPMUDRAFT_38996 [Sphaerulina musiva SO2202]|uniref:Uncharacterized protein n=1 Tax=Sphaerulina musiva (strain SO2202) TaxID=692275 RepID=M3DEJ5_SPHMS|nr:uncharacterized protein SEPMUDRAFT_38996 [Sphaerulina musiva SO2202]EMF15929.1 hypothetical protein SEPMUDRAFT_38996 [Sphaerulina musiva SO2202]